jgi:DNA-3-methyladenine glycosylase
MKLPVDFYIRPDVVEIARDLLGKYLITSIDGYQTGGIITETEAYAGMEDRASHAWNGRRTNRTEVMYGTGGVAYVYLIYGIHSLFNVVTNIMGIPHAVLIRGIYPVAGLEHMFKRLGSQRSPKELGKGPGLAAKVLGIHYSHSGTSLTGDKIWLEDRGLETGPETILVSPRIGIDYAGEDAKLPYRFLLATDMLNWK